MKTIKKQDRLKRSSGILLPIFSLPNRYGIGSFGESAYRFIDFLESAKQHYWQVLPLGPTSVGDSPYQSFSAYAGNPYFIDLDMLVKDKLLSASDLEVAVDYSTDNNINYEWLYKTRYKLLYNAYKEFLNIYDTSFIAFCNDNSFWLDDYSLFMAIKIQHGNVEWQKFPEKYRFRNREKLNEFSLKNKELIDFHKFCQYKFYKQWEALKAYANAKDIEIIGDIPIYVAMDSADVWANPKQFKLDENYAPSVVSGVPPDNFSKTGQLWGNPIYDWDYMQRDNFKWWKDRMYYSAKMFDLIRIDHFIGLIRYYEIPFGSKTAENGIYRDAPAESIIDAIISSIGDKKIIVEDLGVITDRVIMVRDNAGFPGMKIAQFGFFGNPNSRDLPTNYEYNTVAYSGTHDNDTLLGFFNSASQTVVDFAKSFLGVDSNLKLCEATIRTLFESVADTVIIQMQDWLELDSYARINFPSTVGQNWKWRLYDNDITSELASKIADITTIYNRG